MGNASLILDITMLGGGAVVLQAETADEADNKVLVAVISADCTGAMVVVFN